MGSFYLLLIVIRGMALLTEKRNGTRLEGEQNRCRRRTVFISSVLLLLLDLVRILPISIDKHRRGRCSLPPIKDGKAVLEEFTVQREEESEDDDMDWDEEILSEMEGGYDITGSRAAGIPTPA